MATEIEAKGAAGAVGAQLQNDLPTLHNGVTSEAVRLLQQILILHYKYQITFDAHFGQKTEDAVKDFQSKHNLKPDGIVGVNTWRSLGAGL
jgi:peptidoglycan hydrolase-like protein with peptidoglycan-binding domain